MTDSSPPILVCPTAFKGTLSAAEAARAMAAGVRRAVPEAPVEVVPLSDGGPGLLAAIRRVEGGRPTKWKVRGPLSEPVVGRCLFTSGGDAIIESADACGLHLMAGTDAALRGHTLGVGDLVARAVAAGARRVVVGLGGSGTTDGGTGLGRVFGYRFLDAGGRELAPGGGSLRRLASIGPGIRPPGRFLALADVRHRLTGPEGAARTFGPQKGASPRDVEILAEGHERLEDRLRADLGVDVREVAGAGAAGGLGAGCVAFLGARIVAGSSWVLNALGFEERLARARLVVTGEGRYDATSRGGKIVGEVLARTAAAGVPAVLVCGAVVGDPGAARVAHGRGETLDATGLAERVAEAVTSMTV